ncbi:MAG: hypothetical protein GY953_21615 [bacterium]|nr:hypothetical protein [bacterium]
MNGYSIENYQHLRDNNEVFSGLIAASGSFLIPTRLSVSGAGLDRESVAGEYVSGDYFQVLGVQPATGRMLEPGDDAAAVVSWSSGIAGSTWTRPSWASRSPWKACRSPSLG